MSAFTSSRQKPILFACNENFLSTKIKFFEPGNDEESQRGARKGVLANLKIIHLAHRAFNNLSGRARDCKRNLGEVSWEHVRIVGPQERENGSHLEKW